MNYSCKCFRDYEKSNMLILFIKSIKGTSSLLVIIMI